MKKKEKKEKNNYYGISNNFNNINYCTVSYICY